MKKNFKKLMLIISLIAAIGITTGCGPQENEITEEMYNQGVYAIFSADMDAIEKAVHHLSAEILGAYKMDGIGMNTEGVFYEVARNKPFTGDFSEAEKFEYDFLESDERCYEIVDYSRIIEEMGESANKTFDLYKEDSGTEKYYITSTGNVFTLPGFKKVNADKSVEYVVNARGDSYTK